MQSVSANVILGQLAHFGTNCMDLMVDESLLPQVCVRASLSVLLWCVTSVRCLGRLQVPTPPWHRSPQKTVLCMTTRYCAEAASCASRGCIRPEPARCSVCRVRVQAMAESPASPDYGMVSPPYAHDAMEFTPSSPAYAPSSMSSAQELPPASPAYDAMYASPAYGGAYASPAYGAAYASPAYGPSADAPQDSGSAATLSGDSQLASSSSVGGSGDASNGSASVFVPQSPQFSPDGVPLYAPVSPAYAPSSPSIGWRP
jgi:hypothetical protein